MRDGAGEFAPIETLRSKYLRRRYLITGIVLFLAISSAGVAVSFLLTSGAEFWPTIRSLRVSQLATLLFLVVMDWVLGGYRLYMFAHAMEPRVSFFDGFRANLCNMFLGAITPSQTGGGPAHIYVLWRAGLPISGGVALSLINFAATLAVLFIAAVLIVVMIPAEFAETMRVILRFSFGIFAVVMTAIFLLLLAPKVMLTPATRLVRAVGRLLGGRMVTRTETANHKLTELVGQFQQSVAMCTKKNPHLLAQSLGVTFVLYFNKCLIGYVIAQAMGLSVAFWNVIIAQVLLLFVCYFAPTPGAGFIAEVSNTFLMRCFTDSTNVAAFTVGCRLSTIWLAVVLGAVFMVLQIRRDTREYLKPKE